jgi:hypothetical protein
MKVFPVSILLLCVLAQTLRAATTLPAGPYGFNSFAEFDSNFKRGAGSTQRDSTGIVYIRSGTFGSAVFDTSAMSAPGGSGGSGGISGSDANNDLSNFTIQADISGSVAAMSLAGFYLRLDANEANGYLAAIKYLSPTQIAFSLSEGASVSADGATLFAQTLSLSGMTLAAGVFYPFRVSANAGRFDFDFANGAATASFTDGSVSRTIGQAGFLLRNPDAQLDNFSIVPEPNVSTLSGIALAIVLCAGARRKLSSELQQTPGRSQKGSVLTVCTIRKLAPNQRTGP